MSEERFSGEGFRATEKMNQVEKITQAIKNSGLSRVDIFDTLDVVAIKKEIAIEEKKGRVSEQMQKEFQNIAEAVDEIISSDDNTRDDEFLEFIVSKLIDLGVEPDEIMPESLREIIEEIDGAQDIRKDIFPR